MNTFKAAGHCFVVAHNAIDDYRIVELDEGQEVGTLLPYIESFESFESAQARIPTEYRVNEQL